MRRKHNLGKGYIAPLILGLILSVGTIFSQVPFTSVNAADETVKSTGLEKETEEAADNLDENQNRGGYRV